MNIIKEIETLGQKLDLIVNHLGLANTAAVANTVKNEIPLFLIRKGKDVLVGPNFVNDLKTQAKTITTEIKEEEPIVMSDFSKLTKEVENIVGSVGKFKSVFSGLKHEVEEHANNDLHITNLATILHNTFGELEALLIGPSAQTTPVVAQTAPTVTVAAPVAPTPAVTAPVAVAPVAVAAPTANVVPTPVAAPVVTPVVNVVPVATPAAVAAPAVDSAADPRVPGNTEHVKIGPLA